jgi:peptide/nickel transport system substrate-binding protein
MNYSSKMLVGVILLFAAHSAAAETPKDILVMANAIDDIISLDPAEIFEFSGAEYAANTYDRLIAYDLNDPTKLYGVAAESWTVSENGKTFTFKIRPGIRFASGNPLTAEDVAFSFQRVVLLNKSPASILSQFGFNAANVKETIRAPDPLTLVLETDKAYAPTFVLYCLTATVGSIVDKRELMNHAKGSDLGHAWLRTAYAGSGPFKLRLWKPNEVLILDRQASYWDGTPAMKQVVIRHIVEPASQRLLLGKGDIDIARKLTADQLAALSKDPAVRIRQAEKGAIYYLSLNQKNPYLARPQVRQALRYLVDYQGIANTLLKGRAILHQAFLSKGMLGALTTTPFALDVEKAKTLLAEAGLVEGFSLTMDTRNSAETMAIAQSLQTTFAKAKIKLEIIPADNKLVLTKYRGRSHVLYLGRWGADYQDPHANASTFASNPDNADTASLRTLAWRNAWDIPEMTRKTAAAVLERDPDKRAQVYLELQREHQQTSPFVILFQEIEVIAERSNVHGFVIGPSFDSNRYAGVSKD